MEVKLTLEWEIISTSTNRLLESWSQPSFHSQRVFLGFDLMTSSRKYLHVNSKNIATPSEPSRPSLVACSSLIPMGNKTTHQAYRRTIKEIHDSAKSAFQGVTKAWLHAPSSGAMGMCIGAFFRNDATLQLSWGAQSEPGSLLWSIYILKKCSSWAWFKCLKSEMELSQGLPSFLLLKQSAERSVKYGLTW